MLDNVQLKKDFAALWQKFETWEVPVHSLLVSQGGELLWETYHTPYQADTLHRMFSITKSYSALAVGCLEAEGKLSLDDPIAGYFPEYRPADGKVHPYLAEMTIRDMLMMQTCHSATTYKLDLQKNWVESFFITPPTHKSGQIFMYDTSSSHTLAALVKKLSGLGVLDYLRTQFLDAVGFSKEAYIVNDPFGSEMGGSGLMARPLDLLAAASYVLEQVQHGTDKYSDYLRAATGFQVPTLHSGQTLDEQQGYGYQFWRIRYGFAMYGMGGQYVLFYPELDLILVITADAQNIKGGNQKILDAVFEVVAPHCCGGIGTGERVGSADTFAVDVYKACGTYKLLSNKGQFTELTVALTPDKGLLILNHPDAIYQIPFGWDNKLEISVLAKYNQRIASSGRWLDEQSLLVYTQIVGECVGSLSFMIRFRDGGITLWMKKVEESYFDEFCDFADGVLLDTSNEKAAEILEKIDRF